MSAGKGLALEVKNLRIPEHSLWLLNSRHPYQYVESKGNNTYRLRIVVRIK